MFACLFTCTSAAAKDPIDYFWDFVQNFADSFCSSESGETSIADCTSKIDSGDVKGKELGDVYFHRGSAYRVIGMHDRAIADYAEAIEVDREVIRLHPDNFGAYNTRGLAYYLTGEYDRAIADFTEAIRIIPSSFAAYRNRGVAYHAKGELGLAIADYDQAMRINSKDARMHNLRAAAYHARGDNDRALADYDEAIRLDYKNAAAFSGQGVVYYALGQYDQAIVDFERAIWIDPADAATFTNLGLVYEAKGDRERAKAEFNTALAMAERNGTWAHATALKELEALKAPTALPSSDNPVFSIAWWYANKIWWGPPVIIVMFLLVVLFRRIPERISRRPPVTQTTVRARRGTITANPIRGDMRHVSRNVDLRNAASVKRRS